MKRLVHFFQSETVLVISGIAALISTFFIRPSRTYLDYVDFQVLVILFCLMAVVAGLERIGLFAMCAQRLMERTKSTKGLSVVLVLLCFFSSMFITNDVALLTFVPLAIAILQRFGQKRLIFVVALQTVAANLGSMLMPTGNPQNLYLYSYYNFSMANFLKVTAPITLISLVFITIASLLGKNSFVQVDFPERARIKEIKKLYLYLLLFLLCLLTVFGVLNYWVVFFIVCLTLIVVDRTTLKKIDYSLLLTFIFFFIFVGNLERIERVSVVISQAIAGREYLLSILICQVVSNVPAAIMLSGFTENGEALVLGSNIGGLGSLIASLASLISFRLYTRSKGAQGKKYFLCFTGINLILLVLLAIIGFVFFLF